MDAFFTGGIIFGSLTLILGFILYKQFHKYQETVRKHKKQAVNFWQNFTIGVTSGLMVLVLDRWWSIVSTSNLKIDWSAIVPLIKSLIIVLITYTLFAIVLFLIVLWLLNIGLKSYIRKKK
ncbi:MAG: hypothetical protein ACP5NV_05850 [Candidatus Woesearchaeota archaeon]